ncbi:MAG: transglycosylase domain-containing protein [Bacteroidota bacterium]
MIKWLLSAYRFLFHQHRLKSIGFLLLLLFLYWRCLPQPLFSDPTSMVLTDRQGNLLGARIAADGQWRFPHQDSLPERFIQSIIEFEDRRFFQHPGIDPIGIGRALQQNWRNGRLS